MSNHWQFTAKQTLLGQQIRNIWYFSGGGVEANIQNVIDYMRLAYVNNIATGLVDNWSLDSWDVKDVGTAGLPTVEYSMTLGKLTGGSVAVPLPSSDSCLITFRANVAKPNLTRKFLGGVSVGALGGDALFNSTFVGEVEDFCDDVLDITSTYTGVAVASVQWSGDKSYVTGANIMTFRVVNSNPSPIGRRKQGRGT